ncbi:hypothetical protein V6N13_038866 [Hibiscus sabdariffa]|uniref:Uncharacterized protein n=2 Tax=Hibiscus sabdariffa TaxID=183260 RepID=A0ABR2A2D2_9ROSI
MGVSDHFVPSLCCQVTILEAKNIELKSHANLFIRYYLPAGNKGRIQLNTKQISTKSSPMITWNESFSLECSASIKYLKQQTVVFELRRKRKLGKSVVLGRAEMPWKAVFESPNMEIDRYWLPMVSMNDGVFETGLKPPSIRLSLSMKMVGGPTMEEREKQNKGKQRLKNHIDGGCDCGADYEIFALAAALEGLV